MNKERNYKLDNTKALLIFLVVLGHMADYYVSISDDMKFLFFFIYIFHMPLFIFLSGLFIKSTIDGARLKIEKVFSYLIMFFLLKISLFLIDKYLFLKDINFNTFNEGNVPWYMFAMAAWICLTYLLKNIKPLYLLSFSILLGLIIGYDSYAIDYLVISRIIVYFPFFLLGYYFTSIDLMKIINRKSVQYFSIVFLLSLISFIFINIQEIYQFRGFLTGRNSYEVMNQSVFGGFYRSFFYILAAILALAIMSIMPNKNLGSPLSVSAHYKYSFYI